MNIKKKELKRILDAKDDEYIICELISDVLINLAEHLINKGADIYHANLLSICLLFEFMHSTVGDVRLIDDGFPFSRRSKEILKYFKENAMHWWSWWVINELGSDYCDLIFNMDFLNDREKDVEKAWEIINEWKAEKLAEWERAQFCPDE